MCHPPPRKHDPSRTRRRTRRRTEPSPSSTYRFLLRLRRCGRPEATGGLRVAARSAIGGAAEAFESAWWRTTAAGQSLRCAPQLCAWRTPSPPPRPPPLAPLKRRRPGLPRETPPRPSASSPARPTLLFHILVAVSPRERPKKLEHEKQEEHLRTVHRYGVAAL